MVAASTIRSSWRNVANGARLVASAVVHQTAEEAAVVAQRVTRHGVDAMVSSKAAARQQTTGSTLLEAAAAAAAQSILLTPTALRTTFGSATGYWRNDNSNNYNNNNGTPNQKETTTTAILPGSSNPYESQWRRKQVESHQEPLKVPLSFSSEGNTELSSPSSSSSSSSSSANTTTTTTTILPNPYLLHAPPGLSDDSSSATRPSSSSSLSSATITNSDSDSDSDLDLESHPHPHSLLERTIRPTTNTTLPSPASSQHKNKEPIPAPPAPAPPVSTDPTRRLLKEGRAVPSSRIGRAAGFASLGAGLAWGTASAWAGNLFSGGGTMTNHNNNNGGGGGAGAGAVTSDANADRLAATLCRMRGAALKMGQMLSIQDESLLPPALTRALTQVRQGAEAMPQYQLQKQLESQLGVDWRSRFDSFEDLPFAAASIGQVHRATIRSNSDEDGTGGTGGDGQIRQVVVKVQYPGVARSIESDLQNLTMLVKMTGLAPKGLFLDNVIRVGRDELKVECNYLNESANQQAFQDLVFHDPILRENNVVVPDVVEELTTEQVLVSAYAPGGTIDQVQHLDQEERNRIGRTIMYLTMKELFVWRLMQTDPNWGNFLYDVGSQQTTLIDFGAAREYPQDFVDGYLRIVWANANRDEATLMDQSRRLGFLTGEENELMLRAHTLSGFTLGEPFATDEPFDFRGSKISSRMSEHTSVFMKHRLTPPPEEVYTLHRKLAGAYMLCIKVGAVVSCRDMLEDIVRSHHFQDGLPPPIMSSSSSSSSTGSSSSASS